jgi:microsomal epoxide hydrolase
MARYKPTPKLSILLLIPIIGSFLEFLPILSLLKKDFTPETLPYHVIVPSLPGFAFSESPPLDRDFDLGDVAAIMNGLMVSLGFEGGYVAQGGDIGSKVSRILGAKYASCKGASLPPQRPLHLLTVTSCSQ